MDVSVIFENEPKQWGLRGDPLLWRDMAKNLSNQNMPKSSVGLEKLLVATIEKLTGKPISFKETVTLEKYKSTGMSSGGISFEFWREKGIPLLVSRHAGT